MARFADFLNADKKPGLQGIKSIDKKHISSSKVKLWGSINLDDAYYKHKNDRGRWDYLIGLGTRLKKILFLEVHSGSTGQVSAILAKHKWLLSKIGTDIIIEGESVAVIWVTTSGYDIRSKHRLLANAGISVCSHVHLDRV